jgi:hypothetical protein
LRSSGVVSIASWPAPALSSTWFPFMSSPIARISALYGQVRDPAIGEPAFALKGQAKGGPTSLLTQNQSPVSRLLITRCPMANRCSRASIAKKRAAERKAAVARPADASLREKTRRQMKCRYVLRTGMVSGGRRTSTVDQIDP